MEVVKISDRWFTYKIDRESLNLNHPNIKVLTNKYKPVQIKRKSKIQKCPNTKLVGGVGVCIHGHAIPGLLTFTEPKEEERPNRGQGGEHRWCSMVWQNRGNPDEMMSHVALWYGSVKGLELHSEEIMDMEKGHSTKEEGNRAEHH